MTAPDTADRFAALRQSLGPTGIWAPPPERFGADGRDLAASTEKHGFGSLWIGGSHPAPDAFTKLVGLLDASSRLVIGTGIASIWAREPSDMRQGADTLAKGFPGRFILGLGVSHADGAHPYFVPVEHTSFARQVLGPGPLLIPEMAVVLETDRAAALAAARAYASRYLQLPNYVNNLRRFGYGTEDTDGPGSERLIDALIPHGPSVIAARVRQQGTQRCHRIGLATFWPPSDAQRRCSMPLLNADAQYGSLRAGAGPRPAGSPRSARTLPASGRSIAGGS